MGDPNVNKIFQKKLGEELQLKRKWLISVGTCLLDTVYNLFLEDLKSGIDLHSFFKCSS